MTMRKKCVSERNGRRRFFNILGAVFCVLSLLLSACVVVAYPNNDERADMDGDYAPGELLVKFKDAASDDDKGNAKNAVGADEIKAFKSLGIGHWKLGDDVDVEKALKEFEKKKYDDIIEFAEPNYYCFADAFPTDPMRGEQWNMHNVGQTGGTKDADIDMLEYWNSPSESSDVVVAVLDTGVDYTHPDLANMMWKNTGETGTDANGKDKSTNGIDDDSNGYVDDVYGYDFCNNDNDPWDDDGHGTACAGIVAAERGNDVGVAGMCAKVKIMAVKWINWNGFSTVDGAVAAINYAASFTSGGSKLVKITCSSWRVSGSSKALQTAIKNSGALFVTSAGNNGGSAYQYPAAYTLDNIVSVAASDRNDALAPFSNYGSDWVDLAAPGVDIYVCHPGAIAGGGYWWLNGTSMAAAQVSGAAALWLSNHPTDSIATIKKKIMDNVDTMPAFNGKCVSGGRLNVRKMFGINELPADSDKPEAVSDLAVQGGSEKPHSLTLTWTSVDENSVGSDATAYAYDVRYLEGNHDSFDWANAKLAMVEPAPMASGGAETLVVTGLKPTTSYTFAIKVIDEMGNIGDISSQFAKGTTDESYWAVDDNIQSGSNMYYNSMAFDSDGNPAVAYNTSTSLKFAYLKSDGTWATETVDSVAPYGLDLAWDGSTWVLAYGSGALKFAKRTGQNAWSVTTLESKNVGSSTKSIAVFNKDNKYRIGISYNKDRSGLMYAEYDGSSWTKTLVDSNVNPAYCSLCFDSSGQPAIAYSSSTYDFILKYARRASGTWTIKTVGTGVGYGVNADLKLDSNDKPYILCSYHVFSFFTPNAQGGWDVESQTLGHNSGGSLALDETGGTVKPYISCDVYLNIGAMRTEHCVMVATKMDGKWQYELVDPEMNTYSHTTLQFYYSNDGTTTTKKLGMAYCAWGNARAAGITYAERDLLNPSAWG